MCLCLCFSGLTVGCRHHWVSAARCTGGTLPPASSRFDAWPDPGTFLWGSGGTLSCSRCWSWRQKLTCAPRRGGERSAHGTECTSQSETPCVGSRGAAGWCPVGVRGTAGIRNQSKKRVRTYDVLPSAKSRLDEVSVLKQWVKCQIKCIQLVDKNNMSGRSALNCIQ